MRKSLLAVVGLTAMMLATPSFAAKETQADLQKEAKISMKKARSIALKKVPNGKIASSELERENGKLIYSFDIKTGKGGVTEVNVDAINGPAGLAPCDTDIGVSWLPLNHDMGLVGMAIAPVYARRPAVLLPPQMFVKRPVEWLRTISRYRGTISFAPNFAYDLCVRRVKERDLDVRQKHRCRLRSLFGGISDRCPNDRYRKTVVRRLCGFVGFGQGRSDPQGPEVE